MAIQHNRLHLQITADIMLTVFGWGLNTVLVGARTVNIRGCLWALGADGQLYRCQLGALSKRMDKYRGVPNGTLLALGENDARALIALGVVKCVDIDLVALRNKARYQRFYDQAHRTARNDIDDLDEAGFFKRGADVTPEQWLAAHAHKVATERLERYNGAVVVGSEEGEER